MKLWQRILFTVFAVLALVVYVKYAWSLDIAWDQHLDIEVRGYTVYMQKQGGSTVWQHDIPSRAITTFSIQDTLLQIGAIYDVWMTAYNDQGNSGKSNVIQIQRNYVFNKPATNWPTTEYDPQKPTAVTITASP